MKEHKEPSNFVKLASVLGGIFLVIVIIVIILAKEMTVFVLTNVVWAFVVLGIVLGAFQYKSMIKK